MFFGVFNRQAGMEGNAEQQVHLIAGLGNPGREYRDTRHNIGFMVLDRLAGRLGERFARLESKSLVAKATHQGSRLILAKPQTFMNESGRAVGGLIRFYKVPLDHVLVVYDDVDLPFGTLRLRPMGGSAGQKGMRSILEQIGTEELARLRMGIGRPPGKMDAAVYVLRPFSAAEVGLLPELLDRAADAVLVFVAEGLEKAMNTYNGPITV
jgi:PTH1 family peptidyl-tRNA hydrolase